MSEWPLVSVVLVAWNSQADLSRCLPSLAAQNYPHVELIVVDNASPDGTADWVSTHFPSVSLWRNKENVGFATAVNQGFALARGEILVELNPDTTVEANWLFPLVEAMQGEQARGRVGLATARVMLMSTPQRINACGNEMSLTGLTFCIGVGKTGDSFSDVTVEPVPAISGAAFAISRECYDIIGGFDADYFTYFEDTDLSWRARLAGFEVVLAAQSVVYHDYEFRFSPRKMYWIERNRYLTLLKYLRFSTLVRLLPALLLGEAIAWGYALLHGPSTLVAKAQATGWLLANMGDIRRRRHAMQALRQVEDEALVSLMTTAIRFDQTVPAPLGDWMNRLIEPLLRWWRRQIVRPSNVRYS